MFSKLILTKVFANEEYHLSYEAISGDARGLKQEKMYPPETHFSVRKFFPSCLNLLAILSKDEGQLATILCIIDQDYSYIFIHSFIQHVFIEHLLKLRARPWEVKTQILLLERTQLWETDHNQIPRAIC